VTPAANLLRRHLATGSRARCSAGALWTVCTALVASSAWAAPAPSAPELLAQVVPGSPVTPAAPPPAPGQPGPTAPPGVPTEKEGAQQQQGAPQGPEKPQKNPAKPKKKWYHAITRWIDPHEAPFIPVPEIAVDPDSGTTLGIIPTILVTDENDDIRKIIAPDLVHNPFFGWGAHGRIYNYTSPDEQWSIVSGIFERVEREFDGEYQLGRLRNTNWSFNGSAIYDVDGTPRFFGIGNESPAINETDYTAQQYLVQGQLGYNFNHTWQLQYTARFEDVDVLPGTLSSIASIQTRFANLLGEGTNKQVLNRLSVVYDTRDDIIIPSKGAQLVAYAGMASRDGFLNDSLYTETGFDGRAFFPFPALDKTVIAAHMALRYLLSANNVPFWALSSLGGADTVIDQTSTLPFEQLHKVYGLGFRGLARPYVVGFVDIGYGSEGAAVFTGINYPF
jgi:hypothetical protein